MLIATHDDEETFFQQEEHECDLFVLGYENDRPGLPETTDIISWGQEYQINEAVITSIVAFGLQDPEAGEAQTSKGGLDKVDSAD